MTSHENKEYYGEAMINYGEAMTFDLAISGEKETIAEKGRR